MTLGYFKPYLEGECIRLGIAGLELDFLESVLEQRFALFENGVYDNILLALYDRAEGFSSTEQMDLLRASTTFKTVGRLALYKAGRGKNVGKREDYRDLSLKSFKREWDTDTRLASLGIITGNDGSFYNHVKSQVGFYVQLLQNLDRGELRHRGNMYVESLDREFSTPENKSLFEQIANEVRKHIKPISEEDVAAIENMSPEELFKRLEELSGDIDETD